MDKIQKLRKEYEAIKIIEEFEKLCPEYNES